MPMMHHTPVDMMGIIMRVTWTMVVLVGSGCSLASRSIDVARLGSPNQIELHEGGRAVVERPIVAGSKEEQIVSAWLESHSTGWKPTSVTYAPARCIRGDNFSLNFRNHECVLNYRVNDRGAWVQVSRPMQDGEPIPDVFGHEVKP
jgi:hypothetical protein